MFINYTFDQVFHQELGIEILLGISRLTCKIIYTHPKIILIRTKWSSVLHSYQSTRCYVFLYWIIIGKEELIWIFIYIAVVYLGEMYFLLLKICGSWLFVKGMVWGCFGRISQWSRIHILLFLAMIHEFFTGVFSYPTAFSKAEWENILM